MPHAVGERAGEAHSAPASHPLHLPVLPADPKPSSPQIRMRSDKTSVSWLLGSMGPRDPHSNHLLCQPHTSAMTLGPALASALLLPFWRHWHLTPPSIAQKEQGICGKDYGQNLTRHLAPLGQPRLLRSINKSNEGVFLARFSCRKRYVWGAIEHHFVICWLDWMTGLGCWIVRPLFKIWFRMLEVLTKKLVLSGLPEITRGELHHPKAWFLHHLCPKFKSLQNFNMHATNQLIQSQATISSFPHPACVNLHSIQFEPGPSISLEKAHPNALRTN